MGGDATSIHNWETNRLQTSLQYMPAILQFLGLHGEGACSLRFRVDTPNDIRYRPHAFPIRIFRSELIGEHLPGFLDAGSPALEFQCAGLQVREEIGRAHV